MKRTRLDKKIVCIFILFITIILSTIALCNRIYFDKKINNSHIIECLEKDDYKLIESNSQATIYSKSLNSEEIINIKISKKNIIFKYNKNTSEYKNITTSISINAREKRIPEVIRVTGEKDNQIFNFQYYIKEDRLEYNANNYIPPDAWQISKNILNYYEQFQDLIF